MLYTCFVKELWIQKAKRNSTKTWYCDGFLSLHLQFKWKMFLQFCNIFNEWSPVQYIYFPRESLNSLWFYQQRDKKAPSSICAEPKQTLHLTIICLIGPSNDICSLTSPNKRSLFCLCDRHMRALRPIEMYWTSASWRSQGETLPTPWVANVRKCGETLTSFLLLAPLVELKCRNLEQSWKWPRQSISNVGEQQWGKESSISFVIQKAISNGKMN